MKANELMIGDWVMVNDIEHTHPLQIAEIFKKCGAYYATLYWDGMPDNVNPEKLIADIDKVLPIPITKEILEKIGLRKGYAAEYYDQDVYSDEFDTFGLTKRIDGSYVFETFKGWCKRYPDGSPEDYGISSTNVIGDFKYIHELQHVLKLCRIEKTIEL